MKRGARIGIVFAVAVDRIVRIVGKVPETEAIRALMA